MKHALMHAWRVCGLLAWLVLAAGPVAAQGVDPATVEALMRKSGLWTQLGELGRQMQAGIATGAARASQPVDARAVAFLKQTSDRVYAPASLQAQAARELAAGLPQADVPALMAWLDSPLGQRIAALEEQSASSTEDRVAALQRKQALLESLPGARTDALMRAVQASRVADAMTTLATNMQLAMLQGADQAGVGMSKDRLTQARKTLSGRRAEMVQAYTQLAMALFAETYAPLSDQELDQYTAFLRSPHGARFNDLGIRTVDTVLGAATADLGRAAAEAGAARGRK